MATVLSSWGRVLFFLVLSRNFVCEAKYTFALVPKSIDNPFFDVARDGCMDNADILGVTCLYTGSAAGVKDSDGSIQAQIISDLIDARSIDGLAISVGKLKAIEPVIEQAMKAGIPVITFDSDAPNSKRIAYIGTDNYFFGVQLAKVLKQLVPTGGIYGALGYSSPNIAERLRGFEDEISASGKWTAAEGSPANYKQNLTLAIEQMYAFAKLNVTAITPVLGGAMRSGLWKDFVDENRDRNITLVSGDAMPNQLEFLSRGYVQGLVGQLPYQMGFMAMKTLYDLAEGGVVSQEIMGTNLLTHLEIPMVLPELRVNYNLIGNLHVVGYILFGLIACGALGFGVWTYRSRNVRVVKVAQPMFLIMVTLGVLVMASSILPLSFEDGGVSESLTDREGEWICMSVPWLGFCGFTITFSALFSKTMRINRIFHAKVQFGRIKVTMRDVMTPFAVLLSANIVVLTCWTVIDPLIYVREDHPGTDDWNRIISTYGSCQSTHVMRYLIPLACVNLSVLMIANWQAYVSRAIESEFAESKYIAMTMASLLQAGLSGVPILFVVRENPQAFYLILIFMVFVICMAVLLLIFVPKVVMTEAFTRRNEQEQRQLILRSIRRSTSGRLLFPGVQSSASVSRLEPNSILTCISEVNESPVGTLSEADKDGGEGLSSGAGEDEEGMKVVRRETILVLSTSEEYEDGVEAPQARSSGNAVQSDTTAHCRDDEEVHAAIAQLEREVLILRSNLDEREAPRAKSGGDILETDTTTHSREEEEGSATVTQLEISNDSEHRGV
jgi:ABC-type sugar transport system substrate-binding protein